MYNIQ